MKLLNLLAAFVLFTACIANSKADGNALIGEWSGYLIDSQSGEKIEPMAMKFTNDGQVIYTLGEGEMQNVMTTTYRAKNNMLYIKNPNDQKEEGGPYEIKGKKLVITNTNEGIKNEFVRK